MLLHHLFFLFKKMLSLPALFSNSAHIQSQNLGICILSPLDHWILFLPYTRWGFFFFERLQVQALQRHHFCNFFCVDLSIDNPINKRHKSKNWVKVLGKSVLKFLFQSNRKAQSINSVLVESPLEKHCLNLTYSHFNHFNNSILLWGCV